MVQVLDGTRNGAVSSRGAALKPVGSLGGARRDAAFGAALDAGDLDGDGIDDLVVGAPGAPVRGRAGAGVVHAVPGSPSGLDGGTSRRFHQSDATLRDRADAGDRFGASLAIGDLDGDGDGELAVGSPGENAGAPDAGAAHVIDAALGSAPTSARWTMASRGVAGATVRGAGFGTALGMWDIDGDGRDELGVGIPGATVRGRTGAGRVQVIDGPSVDRATRGVPRRPASDAGFGSVLAN